MTIGYLGPVNSFSYQAAHNNFSEPLQAFASIPICLSEVKKGRVEFALVPIENSLEGSVHATIDALSVMPELFVYQEVVLPIKQQLLSRFAAPEKIYSHPQALAQCEKFIAQHFPNAELIPTRSTTSAVLYLNEHPEAPIAAIASKDAATYYDVPIISADIQDNDLNQTRFWLVGRRGQAENNFPAPSKLSIVLELPTNLPGSLHRMLACFGWRNINLSKIESRPKKTYLGEYFFVIDIVIDHNQTLINNAFEEISLLGGTCQILGCYRVSTTA